MYIDGIVKAGTLEKRHKHLPALTANTLEGLMWVCKCGAKKLVVRGDI